MLQKQAFLINFAQGLDTKTDPFQLAIGNFLSLENSVFTKGKRLTKRNGYGPLAALPFASSFGTTFNGDLTAISTAIQAYSSGNESWVSKGKIQPLTLDTLPLIRNNINQNQSDTAIALNGYICTVYTENNGSSNSFKYAIADSVTGQNIAAPTVIPNADASLGFPRVFFVGIYFVIVYAITSTNNLVYYAISSINVENTSSGTISTSYSPHATGAADGVVFSNNLYLAWNGSSSSGLKMAYITPTLIVSASFNPDSSHSATSVSVCADSQNSLIWASYYNSATSTGYSLAVNTSLATVVSAKEIISSGTIINIASAAQSGILTAFYEVSNNYSYDSAIPTHFISSVTVTQSSGSVSSPIVVLRSVGLASKAFIIGGEIYFLSVYQSPFQPTYFLVNGSSSISAAPVVIAKLAYENGGGYLTTGLPSVNVSGTTASVSYLYKDLIQALSNANSAGTSVVGGVYSQTGINLASFTLGSQGLITAEIGTNLNISGGFLIGDDGYSVTEQGFHLWPDSVEATATATTGGHLSAQIYFALFTYEWTDNQGNAFRSATSIPVEKDISSSGTSTNTITWNLPMLRITAKVANPVKIVGYRWSTAQQTFYQFTSITVPVLNDTTADSVTIVDTLSDASILGNNIIYTDGGTLEDTGAPSSSAMTLFDDRLWLVDAEDQNLLWFSKQVIEATPVEMSDLLTLYVAPSIGATGPTGPMKALSAMDDKLIIFKETASYYINGTGPDNTGANSQYSPPTFITSMVGCSNQNSIIFQPQGLMFEFASESGNQIWLLGRDLQTQYIGAPMEEFTKNATVLSAVAVPGTNEVRFNMSSGITLKYDYFYGQWGTHSTNAVSSTIYQGLHTYIAPNSSVYQETPGIYLDGTNPVLMSFKTAWINVAGLRGYQRAFFFYLLGEYFTPFKLACSIAYDYESGPSSFAIINPTNFAPNLGNPESNGQVTVLGQDTPLGGQGNVLNWRVFLKKQRCSSIQISIQEIYDPSFGIPAGQGFSLSGISLVCAVKSGFRTISAGHSVGST